MGSLGRVSDISAISLLPVDLDNPVHHAELYRQRVLCGWNKDMLSTWHRQMKEGTKAFFWIMPVDPSMFPMPEDELCNEDRTKTGPRAPDPSFRPLGHVALDWKDPQGDESLASKEESRIMLATFFILLSQQGRGLGTLVMKHLEDTARKPPFEAKEITIHTLAEAMVKDAEFWRSQGLPAEDPTRRVNERWYERLGYVKYKEEPRYPAKTLAGEDIKCIATFMKKKLA